MNMLMRTRVHCGKERIFIKIGSKRMQNMPFIMQRADPYITYAENRCYFTASVPSYDRIVLRASESLMGLADAPEHTIWTRHTAGEMSQHIWAPELHRIDNAWYLFFAASRTDDIWALRPYVLRCQDADPLTGSWVELGMPKPADAYTFQDFSLDMTTFCHNGRRYAVWAEKVSVGQKISNLYIAELESASQLKSQQVLLSSPDYDWERVDFWVNEGPAFLAHDGKVFLTFSASATGACYCMGLLWADADADLLDPASWKKSREPVLKTDAARGFFGPGHNCFFQTEDGQTYMAFHARTYETITGDPLYDPNRHTFLMRIIWENGMPVFSYDNIVIVS